MSGLYIHIPFCHSKCAYCDFYSTQVSHGVYESYINALLTDYDNNVHRFKTPFTTVYIGGGTPSMLPPEYIEKLVNGLVLRGVETSRLREFTIEANPEDVTPQWVERIQRVDIRRISMGIQSLNSSELAVIGRRHTPDRAIQAATLLRDNGLIFNLDLIYGLPGQTCGSWQNSLEQVLDLHPHHLSAYMLTYEPGTRLSAMLSVGKIKESDEESITTMYNILIQKSRDAGYEHYEISNFARDGWRAIHNSQYWDGTPYLGLGASAHSYDGKIRTVNIPNIKHYISGVGATIEQESDIDRMNDYIVTALRTSDGLDIDLIKSHWGSKACEQLMRDALSSLKTERLILDNSRLRIPEEHWLTSDDIIRRLIIV